MNERVNNVKKLFILSFFQEFTNINFILTKHSRLWQVTKANRRLQSG